MRYLICVLALVLFGCGSDSPTAPTPAPQQVNIAGNWSGTFTFTPFTGGARTVSATTATFTQGGANFSGQINTQFTDRTAGTISGTITGSTLQGTMTFTNSAGCNGTASVSGTISTTIQWVIPTVASTNCNWFTNVTIVLNRQ